MKRFLQNTYCQKEHVRIVTISLLAFLFVLVIGLAESGWAQTQQVPPTIFKNYFVTGDYMVAGWVEQSSNGTYATGTISIPDETQISALGSTPPVGPTTVPTGADIVAAYLYWATVEGNQTTFTGQQAFFNGYKITGDVLGNPNAPTSWSSGGCTGGSTTGSKTMRMYRADVRPYLPLDLNPNSATFGAISLNGTTLNPTQISVQIADSGSNGNTQPNALGATLVVVYRLLPAAQPSPAQPLNAVVLYDGSYAPFNSNPTMMDTIAGFYEPGIPAGSMHPKAKLTQIVANGQSNKGENVFFGSNPNALSPLPLLYPNLSSIAAFPGVYGAWDNPTWDVSSLVNGNLSGYDQNETLSVSPTSSNSGCVNWGAIVMSTTVQDTDGDGLLDVWEGRNQGYTDAVTGQPVALPGADPSKKDLFVEVDYLASRDSSGNVLHSHLPKQQALDNVAAAFAAQSINVHFDVGGVYQSDPNNDIINAGTGGNEILESSLLCTDGAALCEFPNQPAVSWKGGFEFVQNSSTLGKFQPGRAQSYRYMLSGHSTGEPRSYWGTAGFAFATNDPADFASSMPQLVSIVNTGSTAVVTIKSPSGLLKPGDFPGVCNVLSPPPACSDINSDRITISGSFTAPFVPNSNPPQLAPAPLNGTYKFTVLNTSAPDNNGVITTMLQITTSGVADGTYQFSCGNSSACFAEPQLGVSYLGPTSTSGHADFAGGGDLAMTLGLWRADDPIDPATLKPACQPDPSQPATSSGYCNDQVGTLNVQTGTLMHELGHTLTLTHGGTYYQPGSSVPTYELNCKPNFISVMNYLFQVRGFADTNPFKFDYSGQNLPQLNETSSTVNGVPPLSESNGVGTDNGQPATHLTRWYAKPNSTDTALGDQALAHCDGTPLSPNEPREVRVDGTLATGGTFSAPLDWNNDLTAGDDPIAAQDLNHNGIIGDVPFSGFDDWAHVDFQQMNARASGFGFSDGGGLAKAGGGGLAKAGGGGVDPDGGGLAKAGGGGLAKAGGGGLAKSGGGGVEQDAETANSTVTAPSSLACTQPLTITGGTVIPACTGSSPVFAEKGRAVPLTWTPPSFGQIRKYDIWRAVGSFATSQQVFANFSKFAKITNPSLTGTPPAPQFVDSTVKNNTTYTYFVTDANKFGAQSGASASLVVTVKF